MDEASSFHFSEGATGPLSEGQYGATMVWDAVMTEGSVESARVRDSDSELRIQ